MEIKDLSFVAPGAGVWMTDGEHTPRPVTPMTAAAFVEMDAGMRLGAERYGWLLDGMQVASINRFLYYGMRSLIARRPGDDEASQAAYNAQMAANPVFQQRIKSSEAALASKRWLADAEHWDNVGRPWVMGITLDLTDVQVQGLDDEGLCLHLDQVRFHLGSVNAYHHILNPISNNARGMLFLRLHEWAEIPAAEVESLLIGSSPISAGDEPELRTVCQALKDDGGALGLLDAVDGKTDADPSAALAALMDRDGAVGKAARAYVRMTGYRTVVGWEAMEPYNLEVPENLLATIRYGLAGEYAKVDPAAIAGVRDRVPGAHRDEFDVLLGEARALGRIRDERDLYCNVPVSGLLRRAVLEAGRRARERGLVDDVEHMTECAQHEIHGLLKEGKGPSAGELRDRHIYRQSYTVADIPAMIGEGDMLAGIPTRWLPAAMQTFQRMQISQRGLDAGPPDAETETGQTSALRGLGASPGQYEGVARVLMSADQLAAIEPGEVLVTLSTNPAFNIVMAKIGALVTEHGGRLSHSAIVAREFGLPAVVGVRGATVKIATGDQLRVDADKGEVTVL
jgi:pyruvate,water dikinase